MKTSLFLCALASVTCYIYAQECRTPDGGLGICQVDCPFSGSLKQDDLTKRAIACGGNSYRKSCCSNCITPDGKSGIRKKIEECPSLMKKLETVTPENGIYINKSKIKNTREYCCGPLDESQPEPQKAAGHRCDSAFASLPDPSTRCCGIEAGLSNKIVGGNTAEVYDYPWTVFFDFEDANRCGGSLITNRHVITAAHCFVRSYKPPPKTLRVGELDTEKSGPDCQHLPDGSELCTDGAEIISVESYLAHPEYNNYNHDIALVRLSRPVNYTKFIRPICLPSLNYGDGQSTHDFTVAGWGVDNSGFGARYKQFARLQSFDFTKCSRKYQRRYRKKLWIESHICAGGKPGVDSCGGDSGGPLMAAAESYYELAGAVSLGFFRCGTNPAVYTNVYTHLDWIRENVRQLSQHWVTVN